MDERELGALFEQVARDTPPATFDEHDVARGARRVTARRRVVAGGGSLVAAALVVGGVGTGTGAFFDEDRSTVASPPPAQATPEVRPEVGPAPHAQVRHGPMVHTERDSGAGVMSAPAGGTGCGPADPGVAAAVTEQLPTASAVPPRPAEDCPDGSRAAAFRLRDGGAAGSVTVILAPASSAQPPAPEAPGPDGSTQVVDHARSGRVLVVRSEAEGGSGQAPYAGRLGAVADGLSARL